MVAVLEILPSRMESIYSAWDAVRLASPWLKAILTPQPAREKNVWGHHPQLVALRQPLRYGAFSRTKRMQPHHRDHQRPYA